MSNEYFVYSDSRGGSWYNNRKGQLHLCSFDEQSNSGIYEVSGLCPYLCGEHGTAPHEAGQEVLYEQ